jgi:hypothetical protein
MRRAICGTVSGRCAYTIARSTCQLDVTVMKIALPSAQRASPTPTGNG